MKTYCVYILASDKNGTLYTGVTNNLIKRVAQHKRKNKNGFTSKYNVNKLVWYDQTNDIRIAIEREKQIKRWNRKWKIRLIVKNNPDWKDLFYEIGGSEEILESEFII
ncbi:MAG: GIY-YIG nuclease family protein [Ignavibacteria bacterium]|nr:GIY-YIG nuclease family protein [Ignavibacteria bacterium]MBL0108341.1 GIY-YIG nuclease family protein [Ignavibacteria bacterium]